MPSLGCSTMPGRRPPESGPRPGCAWHGLPADKLRCHGPRDCRLDRPAALSRRSGVEVRAARARCPIRRLDGSCSMATTSADSSRCRSTPSPPSSWKASIGDKSVPDLPRRTQTDLLGRGLGRVIAHEIGHWRMGRAHAPGPHERIVESPGSDRLGCAPVAARVDSRRVRGAA